MAATGHEFKEITPQQCNEFLIAFKKDLQLCLEAKQEPKSKIKTLQGSARESVVALLEVLNKIKLIEIPKMHFDYEELQRQARNTIDEIQSAFIKTFVDAYVRGRVTSQGFVGRNITKSDLLADLEETVKSTTEKSKVPLLTAKGVKEDNIDAAIFASLSGDVQRQLVKDLFDRALKAIYEDDKMAFANCMKIVYRVRGASEWNNILFTVSEKQPGCAGLKLDYTELSKAGLKFSKDKQVLKEDSIEDLFDVWKKDGKLQGELKKLHAKPGVERKS